MTFNAARLLTAGTVALAFLALVGFLVWRLTPTKQPVRVLAATAMVLAGLPPVLYALLAEA